jgi:hypothetical protein
MKNKALYLLALFSITSCGLIDTGNSDTEQKDTATYRVPPNQNQLASAKLNGKIFQYLPGSDILEHLFTIVFHCKNDTLSGVIFGPAPEGNEGLYFKSNLDSVTLNNTIIRFSFVQKDFYSKPFTVENYNKPFDNKVQQGSNFRVFYKGYLHSDTITFVCGSEHSDCYADTMNFIEKRNR